MKLITLEVKLKDKYLSVHLTKTNRITYSISQPINTYLLEVSNKLLVDHGKKISGNPDVITFNTNTDTSKVMYSGEYKDCYNYLHSLKWF